MLVRKSNSKRSATRFPSEDWKPLRFPLPKVTGNIKPNVHHQYELRCAEVNFPSEVWKPLRLPVLQMTAHVVPNAQTQIGKQAQRLIYPRRIGSEREGIHPYIILGGGAPRKLRTDFFI